MGTIIKFKPHLKGIKALSDKTATVTLIEDYIALKHAEKLHKAIQRYTDEYGLDPIDVSFKIDPIPEYL